MARTAEERKKAGAQFGFNWEQVSIIRCCTLPEGRKVIQILTDHRSIDIYISRTGRSVRVFENHKELKADQDDKD